MLYSETFFNFVRINIKKETKMSKSSSMTRLKVIQEWMGFNEKWERVREPEWSKGHKKAVKEEKKEEKKEEN